MGTASAIRLFHAGCRVAIAEIPAPTAVRRTVAFSEAVFDEAATVEGVTATLVSGLDAVLETVQDGRVPVLIDPYLNRTRELHPDILVDATLTKVNRGISIDLAPGTIALGPGFIAGVDVHAVVETNRGSNLGRVIWNGEAEANTHVPGLVAGHSTDRVLRSPETGRFDAQAAIGALVEEGEIIGSVDAKVIAAPFRGIVRGLVRSGLDVMANMKIGDVDPRLDPGLCYRISDKAFAVAGGAAEATSTLLRRNAWRWRKHG